MKPDDPHADGAEADVDDGHCERVDASDSDIVLGRCVFVPPGGGPRVLYGEDAEGNLVHVSMAENGERCGLTCPDCGGALRANQGQIKQHYFSHVSKDECENAGETALHRIAKDIINEQGELTIPSGIADLMPSGTRVLFPSQRIPFKDVEVEPLDIGFRPDLNGWMEITRDGVTVRRRLIIEIHVTHKVDKEKLARLRERGDSALEIDLSKVDRSLTREDLTQLLMRDAPRHWLYNRHIARAEASSREAYWQREEAREKAKEERRAFAKRKEEERKAARSRPAKGGAHEDLSNAREELNRWRVIKHEKMVAVSADGSLFDVEPLVWKTFALSHLAPWSAELDIQLIRRGTYAMAEVITERMIQKGWVKPEYVGMPNRAWVRRPGYEFDKTPRPQDMVKKFLDSSLMEMTSLGASVIWERKPIDAIEPLKKAWGECLVFKSQLGVLAKVLMREGAVLRHSGIIITEPEDFERILYVSQQPAKAVLLRHWMEGIIEWLVKGWSRSGVDVNTLMLGGYEIILDEDDSEGHTERAWHTIIQRVQDRIVARIEAGDQS